MDVAGVTVSVPAVAVLGVFIGFLAGMFGVGGGFLLTPLLSVVFGVPMPIAVGTGLCQMVGTSTVAWLRHRKLRQGEPRIAVVLIAGSLLGVSLGANVVGWLERLGAIDLGGESVAVATPALYAVYIVFLLSVAGVLWRQGQSGFEELEYIRRGPLSRLRLPPYIDLPAVPLKQVSATVIAYVGLGLGFVSGLLGVGGGIALIPILLYGFGFPFRQAAGTGVAATLLTSTVGTIAHARQDHVHLGLALVLLIGGSVSAQIGAVMTRNVPARLLRKGLAALIFATVLGIGWDLSRHVFS